MTIDFAVEWNALYTIMAVTVKAVIKSHSVQCLLLISDTSLLSTKDLGDMTHNIPPYQNIGGDISPPSPLLLTPMGWSYAKLKEDIAEWFEHVRGYCRDYPAWHLFCCSHDCITPKVCSLFAGSVLVSGIAVFVLKKGKGTKISHVRFRPTKIGLQKVSQYFMLHDRFSSADIVGQQNRLNFIGRLTSALHTDIDLCIAHAFTFIAEMSRSIVLCWAVW